MAALEAARERERLFVELARLERSVSGDHSTLDGVERDARDLLVDGARGAARSARKSARKSAKKARKNAKALAKS